MTRAPRSKPAVPAKRDTRTFKAPRCSHCGVEDDGGLKAIGHRPHGSSSWQCRDLLACGERLAKEPCEPVAPKVGAFVLGERQ